MPYSDTVVVELKNNSLTCLLVRLFYVDPRMRENLAKLKPLYDLRSQWLRNCAKLLFTGIL